MARHLVIQLARLGDLVQTGRLLATLAARPESEVHLAVDTSLAGFAGHLYPYAVIHPVAAHAAGLFTRGTALAKLAANREAFAELAAIVPAEAYNCNHSGLNLALARLFPAGSVRGYTCDNGQTDKDELLKLAFRWTRRRGPLGLNLVDLWAHLADNPIAPEAVNPPAVARGEGLGVVLAGRNVRRSLPPEALARAAAAAYMRAGGRGKIHLLGTKTEQPLAREVFAALPRNLLGVTENRAGATTLAELMDLLPELAAVLTPDTGTMHLAARLGVPVLAVFLSSAWCFETGPYGLGHTVFQAVEPCAPCLESAPCSRGVACLAPFATPQFLRHVSGKSEDPGPGLCTLASGLDRVGATYEPLGGTLPDTAERARFRTFMANHLLGGSGPEPTDFSPEPQTAFALYHETDWMLAPSGDTPEACP